MTTIWIYSLSSVIIVSIISLLGVFSLSIKIDFLKKILIYMISLSAGALLGDTFLHLLPQIVEENGFGTNVSLGIIGGIIISFILEKVIHWRHCHHPTTNDHPHPIATMNLFGDALHNFIDGLVIGAAFLIDVKVGVATTIAVILHEIPQEIGDFGVLIHAGYSVKKALLFNFFISLTAILGVVVALVGNKYIENMNSILIPITAGAFIYIASADLIPELHKKSEVKSSILQLLVFMIGVGLMYGLVLFEI